MFLVIYVIFFAILFNKCKHYNSPVLDFVLLFYLAASISSIVTHYFVEPNAYCTPFSAFYQILCFYLFIKPVIVYGKSENNRQILQLNDRGFKLLSYTLVALQLFTIVFFAKFDYMLMKSGDLSQVRSDLLYGNINMGASLSRTIAGTASFYYCINILLYFYSLTFRNDSKWLRLLLIVSSTSRIFHSLTYMGRDGLLFWLLSFVTTYLIFKKYLPEDSKRTVRKSFYACGSFAVVLIALISMSRFGQSDEGVYLSLFSYLGQSINNFGQLFHSNVPAGGTQKIFPILFGETGTLGADVLTSVDAFESEFGFKNNIFFSFIGNMIFAWGRIITLLVSFIYSKYFSNRLNSARVGLADILILLIMLHVCIHNYFYWAYYIRVANLFLLTIPLFVFYLKRNTLDNNEL